MKKIYFIFVVVFMCTTIFAQGGKEDLDNQKTKNQDSVKIENYNRTTEYTSIPKRIIAMSVGEAEILAALGLEDKIIAIAYGHNTINEVHPKYRDSLKDIPIFKEVSLEYIISQKPDFILTTGYRFFLKTFGKYEDYQANNINIYVTEGSYQKGTSLQNTYNDILNIGKIFRIENKANELIKELKLREKAVVDKIKNLKPVKCLIFDGQNKGIMYVAGGTSIQNGIVTLAGGDNIFKDIQKDYSSASLESIITGNPDFIIINYYPVSESDLSSGKTRKKNDLEEKLAFFKSKKELSGVNAIKNNNFISIPLISVFPGIQNLDALEKIAKGLHPDIFK